MNIKTDIFNNIKEFLKDMDDAEQLASLRLSSSSGTAQTSSSLAAFSTTRPARPRGAGRGIPQPQPIKKIFCKTCYENERGKSTYLSHNTNAYNCPTKLKLNTIMDEMLPPEVTDQGDQDDVIDDEHSGGHTKKK